MLIVSIFLLTAFSGSQSLNPVLLGKYLLQVSFMSSRSAYNSARIHGITAGSRLEQDFVSSLVVREKRPESEPVVRSPAPDASGFQLLAGECAASVRSCAGKEHRPRGSKSQGTRIRGPIKCQIHVVPAVSFQ